MRKLSDLIVNYSSINADLNDVYLIAEAGVNHEGSIDQALRLVDAAAEAGADAIKFQTYKAKSLASKNSPAYWDLKQESTPSQYELFKKYDCFDQQDYQRLYEHCLSLGIEFLSTPFDVDSAKLLESMVDVIKVSSSDLNNQPFIEFLARMNKPMLLSTGASYLWEIEQTVSAEKESVDYNAALCLKLSDSRFKC